MFPDDADNIEVTRLDELDRKLIQALIGNGGTGYETLADHLEVSTATVSRRVTALLKKDIIKILAIPNPAKLGYAANAFVVLQCELARVDEICDRLGDFTEVNVVMKLMNNFEVLFSVNTLSPETLYEFVKNRVASLKGVTNTETFIRGDFLYFSADAMFIPAAGLMAGVNKRGG
jgi:DNA-binding Lrp family transcriptional regulator